MIDIRHPVVSVHLPSVIRLTVPHVGNRLNEVIISQARDYDYLPLRVGASQIHGMGMFATRNIRPGCLIMPYIGRIMALQSLERANDSLFTLGTLTNVTAQGYLIVNPIPHGNQARFINSDHIDPNC